MSLQFSQARISPLPILLRKEKQSLVNFSCRPGTASMLNQNQRQNRHLCLLKIHKLLSLVRVEVQSSLSQLPGLLLLKQQSAAVSIHISYKITVQLKVRCMAFQEPVETELRFQAKHNVGQGVYEKTTGKSIQHGVLGMDLTKCWSSYLCHLLNPS